MPPLCKGRGTAVRRWRDCNFKKIKFFLQSSVILCLPCAKGGGPPFGGGGIEILEKIKFFFSAILSRSMPPLCKGIFNPILSSPAHRLLTDLKLRVMVSKMGSIRRVVRDCI